MAQAYSALSGPTQLAKVIFRPEESIFKHLHHTKVNPDPDLSAASNVEMPDAVFFDEPLQAERGVLEEPTLGCDVHAWFTVATNSVAADFPDLKQEQD